MYVSSNRLPLRTPQRGGLVREEHTTNPGFNSNVRTGSRLAKDGRTELSLQGVRGKAQQLLAERMKHLIEEWSSELGDAAGSLQ